MKKTLICSLLLNVFLLAGAAAFFIVAGEHTANILRTKDSVAAKLPAQAVAEPVSPAPATTVEPFRWKQLDSRNDYRLFIANLRGAGCPENTVADIVMGNVNRAFAWQRAKLKIDDSRNGPWSQASEIALINELLGKPNAAQVAYSSQDLNARLALSQPHQGAIGQNAANSQAGVGQVAQLSNPQQYPQYSQAATASSPSPWLAQGGTWSGNLGPSASLSANQSSGGQVQQAQQSDANGQSRQMASSGPQLNADPSDAANSGPNSAPASPSAPYFSPNGVPESDDPYAKSSQDIMAEQQAQYVEWFAQQAANSDGGIVGINPTAAPQQ
jgi:hypothetical protein